MDIEITQENLTRALSNVSRIANGKGGLDILNNVLLRTDGNQLVIAATNLELAATQRIGAKVSTHGTITLPARLTNELVSNLPKGTVSLRVEGNIAKLKLGNNNITINGLADDEFPELPIIDLSDAVEYQLNAKEFKDAVAQTIIAASNDSTRPVLTGLYWHTFEKKLFFAATDGYRLAEKTLLDAETEVAAIIPTASLQEVVRSLSDDIDEVRVLFDDTQVTFIVGEGEVTSRLIDGNYPDYRQLLPQSNETSVKVKKQDLQRIVKLTSLFSRDIGGSIVLSVDVDANTVSLRSTASELGDNESTLEGLTEGVSASVTLSARYLNDALGAIQGDEVVIGFSGKLSPCLLSSGDEASQYKHIIMPIKS